MGKGQMTVTVDKEVLQNIWEYKKRNYPGLSKSAMIELFLRYALEYKLKDEESHKKGLSIIR